MRRVYYLLLTAFVVSMLSSNVWTWPYTAAFVSVFENHRPPYEPGIVASIDFGPIRELEWGRDCDDYCLPPPPMFAVIVDWASPAEPDCYVMVAIGIAGGVYMGSLTLGSCEIRFLDSAKVDLPGVCTQGVHPGWNRYAIWAGPLRSGKYRLRLICFNYPDFRFGLESCPPDKPQYWQYAGTPYVTDEATINIKENCYDFSKITSVFYLANNGTHRVYGNQVLNVLTPYHCVAVLTSTQDAQTIPRELTARLRIDSISAPYPFKFVRWPQADRGSCDTNFMVRHYYYISRNEIIPKEYFDLSPEEWSNVSKVLECDIFGDHSMLANFNDTSIANHVVARLHLDYMNDSTSCFIPAKGDSANFLFMYSDSVGLDSLSIVKFNIENKNGALVYRSDVSISSIHFDTTMFGVPGINATAVPITWHGRCNQGAFAGHLADPENDPYLAYITVNPGNHPMYSNADTANVVPKLDSVIVTHMPSYPPPQWMDTMRVYSIAKCKVDDAGYGSSNYRYYYYSAGDTTIKTLWGWDGSSYHFSDHSGRSFFENDSTRAFNMRAWKGSYWGTLNYKWYVDHDYAWIDQNNWRQFGYTEVDTTDSLGAIWNPKMYNNIYWMDYIDTSDNNFMGQMRLYMASKIVNITGACTLQTKVSPKNDDAHKVIFGPMTGSEPVENWSIIDWAQTHIGVPYFMSRDSIQVMGKRPYTHIDCSGLVIACKIQESWPAINRNYILDNINTTKLVRQSSRLGLLIIDNIRDVHTGDLIVMSSGYRTGFFHVVIIAEWSYNPRTRILENAAIIHAYGRGGTPESSVLRRVRFDSLENLLPENRREGRFYTFLRFNH